MGAVCCKSCLNICWEPCYQFCCRPCFQLCCPPKGEDTVPAGVHGEQVDGGGYDPRPYPAPQPMAKPIDVVAEDVEKRVKSL